MSEISAERTQGKKAQEDNIRTAIMVAEVIKSTLGPKGMDKFLVNPQSNQTKITNDGVTILENIEIKHPLAKIIAEASRTQEDKVGDGTTTVAMLAGKFLEKALELINKGIHPTTILKGYSLAEKKAKEIIENLAKEAKEEDFKNIVQTALTGKSAEDKKELLGELITKAIKVTKGDKDKIILQKSITDEDPNLINGIVMNKDIPDNRMPKQLENPKILLIDMPLEYKQPEQDLSVSVNSFKEIDEFKKAEKNYINEITEKLLKKQANCIICTKTISQDVLNKLAQNNILAFRSVGYYDTDNLESNLDTKIIRDLDEEVNLGTCKSIKQIVNNTESLIYIEGCPKNDVVTLLLNGNTKYMTDELYRATTDAIGDLISVYNDNKILPGGGAVEIQLSNQLYNFAKTIGGKEQIAIQKYAEAFEFIPETLASNAGLDQIEIITELKSKNETKVVGLNLFNNKIEDTIKSGIIEPLKVKTQAISSATEISRLILRIDDILILKDQ